MNTHGLERTSPKGQAFVGRCIYCGAIGLPSIAATWPCSEAPTKEQQILDAIAKDKARSEKGCGG